MTQPDPSSPGPNPADGRGPPPNASQVEVTQLLHAVNQGDPSAGDRLLPLVYGELRRLAQGYMSQERAGQTLQATALVHEAYLRLIGSADVSWASRAQFFAAAAQAMRRILVERARARGRLKRGGGLQRVELDEHAAVTETARTDLVALDEALNRLAAISQRKCDVVMLKFFAGLTNDEVAAALGVSSATVRNEWTFAKAWLLAELEREAARG